MLTNLFSFHTNTAALITIILVKMKLISYILVQVKLYSEKLHGLGTLANKIPNLLIAADSFRSIDFLALII